MIFFIEDSYESADLKILKKFFGCLTPLPQSCAQIHANAIRRSK